MDKAIVGVCFDPRQRRILNITLPSWRHYGQRHGVPVIIIERDYAGGDFYWNKHLLYRIPELKSFRYLLFLDNDVFVNKQAGPLLNEWDSPLIGATWESTQAGWTSEYIEAYYNEYFVERHATISNLQVINTGVLVVPREQAAFLEAVHQRWKIRIATLVQRRPQRKDPFTFAADQPSVSYELQAENRYLNIGERFNTLWYHWYVKNFGRRYLPFLLRSKAAEKSRNCLPETVWQFLFRRERAMFSKALASCEFLHLAGSKSPVSLGTEPTPELVSRLTVKAE